MLYHSSVDSFYEINFALMHYHKWSLSEIENMIPFERDIYMKYLMNALEKERLEAQQAANA
jgi:hypothetical protein|tara:strand:+ start:623 stop:805 length:183 start_codon:yes stop_codon:yes gene_type:complete